MELTNEVRDYSYMIKKCKSILLSLDELKIDQITKIKGVRMNTEQILMELENYSREDRELIGEQG